MKKPFLTIILAFTFITVAYGYNDHRGHNLDSLERAVAKWDVVSMEKASDEQLKDLIRAWSDLSEGYAELNIPKSEFYARKALSLARKKDWQLKVCYSSKMIGQHFWERGQYDSASYYYKVALDAIERMDVMENYTQLDKDDALSSMYGTLGNLYSMQDSVATSMIYYDKALEIFRRYGWETSCAVCYYNMGETYLTAREPKKAVESYEKSLEYAHAAGDSLWIATACKGLGNYYLSQKKTARALRYLAEADNYYSVHEDEELRFRMETLDFTSQVLSMQKKNVAVVASVAVALCIVLVLLMVGLWILRRTQKEKVAAETVLDETIEELRPLKRGEEIPELTDREKQILRLICAGRTNPQIAEEIFLSNETIKWYRKKLLVKFDVVNSAELVRKATEMKVV